LFEADAKYGEGYMRLSKILLPWFIAGV